MPSRRRRRRGRRPGGRGWTLPWNFSASFGAASKQIQLSDVGLDSSRPIRVRSVNVSAVIVGHTQCPTLYLSIPSGSAATIGAYSRPISIGVTPVRLSVRNPPFTDFRLFGTADVLCQLLLKNYYNGTLTVSGTIFVDYMPNDLPGVVKA